MARLEVVKSLTGQKIYFYPQEGVPSSTPTVAIKDSGGSTIRAAAATYVTLTGVSTTVSTAGVVGDSSLILASVSGIVVGQSYMLTNSLQQVEWVRVYSINSSTRAVGFDEPLRYVHDTSATFKSTSFYYTLQTTDVDELVELYRARATYTVSSVQYVIEIPFDVVLTPLVSPLAAEFIKKRRPGLMQFEPAETRGTDFADLREAAWDEVLKGIREQATADGQMRPALVRTPEGLEKWALAEFDFLAQRNGIKVLRDWDPREALQQLEKDRESAKRHSLSGLDYDEHEDDSISEDEVQPIVMDLVR